MPRDEAIVIPDGWLSRGEASVRGQGTQLAVFGGIPGERARVHVFDRHGHPNRARLLAPVGAPSPDRVAPPCDRYAVCGRCPMMHVSEGAQARVQRALTTEAFAGAPVEPAEVVHEEGAQHTLSLVAGWSDERHPRLGVVGRETGRVVVIAKCPILTPGLRELMKVAAHHMLALDVRPFDGRSGSLRAVHACESRASNEILVTMIFARSTPFAGLFAEAIGGALPAVAGVWVQWNDEGGLKDTLEGGASLVYGKPTIEEVFGGIRLRVGPVDPWPARPALAERLWLDAVDALAPAAGDAVLELGAGSGVRTLLLARRAGWALGLTTEEQALRGRENAALNALSAEFAWGPDALDAAVARLRGRRPHVLADAGRAGLDDATVEAIVALAPRRVVLLSTNPRSLARDARRLVGQGLALTRVVPYDAAPHTPFVETMALLTSPDAEAPALRAPRRKRV